MRALGLSIALSLLAPSALAAPPELRPALVKKSFENGLTLVVEEAHRSPRVAIQISIARGWADDPADRRGLARVVGAYLAREVSTRHVARKVRADMFRVLEIAPIEPDVKVEVDRTTLAVRVPPAQLELAFWLLSDALAFGHDSVDSAAVARQRDLVDGAHKQDLGQAAAQRGIESLLYPPTHALGAGAFDGLPSITAADVKTHLRERIGPERTAVVVVGDVDATKVTELASKYFGPIVRGEDKPVARAAPTTTPREARGTMHANLRDAGVRVSWLAPPLHDADDVALDVLYQHLAPRLDELLKKQGVPVGRAAVRERSSTVGSHFDVEVTLSAAMPTDKVVRAIEATIAEAVRSLTDDGVLEARRIMHRKTAFVVETAAGRAAVYADAIAQRGDPLFMNKYLAAYDAVTQESVADVTRRVLIESRRSVLAVVPDATAPPGGRLETDGGAK